MTLFVAAGCMPPVTYVVDVNYTPTLKEDIGAKVEELEIAVIPFEDMRKEKKSVGERRHLTGNVDEFDARPYPVTSAVTQTLVSALKIHGYKTEILQKGADLERINQSPPHIVISGNIEEFRADAVSKPGYTDIKTDVLLQVKVYKVDDRSSYTTTVQSQSEPRVIIFNPSVMQKAINDTLSDAINRLIASKWQNR
ncbi:MAG: hypothetical protein A3D21_07640 [Nitrospirae bacterium RIFCSPHIGHO2_02_FULL_42_12]|nr:MAG: hypothetical protein A3D21_07640 [Nitrospirae bacterium RIFCSPHIGHO2_02_FULL_42_12]